MDLVVSMPPNPSHLEAVDPVRRGHGARGRHRSPTQPGAPAFDPTRSAADPDPRRRGVPGPGRRRRDAEPARLAGLHDRRHDPHHRQQPARVHGRSRRLVQHARTRAAWRAASRSRSSTSTPTIRRLLEAARLAFAYRARFQRDFLIDLVGYRRYGHNEGDEPAFTQPLMYQKIAAHPTVREIWAQTLVERGVIDAATRRRAVQARHGRAAERATTTLKPEQDFVEPQPGDRRRPARPRQAQTGGAARAAARAERGAADAARRLHDPPQARARRARSAGRCSTQPDERTVDWADRRGARATRRSSPTASASG